MTVTDPRQALDKSYAPACDLIMTNSQIAADRPAWQAQRRRAYGDGRWRLTASEMASVVGLAPESYEDGSPYALYQAKLTGEQHFDGNERTLFGLFAEPYISARFAAQHPELAVGEGGLYVSRKHPWLAATFDQIAYDIRWTEDRYGRRIERYEPRGPVEDKTWARRADFGPEGSSVMPDHLTVQLLMQMAVLDTEVAYEAVMFVPYDRVSVFVLERDEQAERDIANLLAAGEDFIARLDEEMPPDVDWTPATTAALQRRFRGLEDREVRLHSRLVRRVNRAKAAVKVAERRRDQALNEVRLAMGDAQRAVAFDPVTGTDRVAFKRRIGDRAAYSVEAKTGIQYIDAGEWGKPAKLDR
jgi:hypothetical protein